MKYATTPELIALNDEAVLNDFNEWLAAPLFDDVAPAGLHILAHAIPHGIRPMSQVTEPAHYRTLWYAQRTDDSDYPVKLDVTAVSFASLPDVPGTPGPLLPAEGSPLALPAVVVLDEPEGWVVDGKHVLEAVKLSGEAQSLPVLTLKSYSDDELAEIRAAIP